MLEIRKFNDGLVVEAQKGIVDFDVFKKMHHGKYTEGGRLTCEAVVASIVNLDKLVDGYKIDFETGKSIIIRFNGTSELITVDGRHIKGGVNLKNITKSRNMDNGHIRYVIEDQSFMIERLIGICKCIEENELPTDFRGLVVNVMDGTGNMYTSAKLKMMPNFNLDNLEWTLSEDNLVAGRKITGLVKRTGSVWRFSANDIALRQVYQTKDNNAIKNYCINNLEKIKDIVL